MNNKVVRGKKIDKYLSKEECTYCGETKVYCAAWDKPICPKCGAELSKLKVNNIINEGNG